MNVRFSANQKTIQAALLAGWRMKSTKKGYMLYPPNPAFPGVLVHKTPSDYRARQNINSLIRRFSDPQV